MVYVGLSVACALAFWVGGMTLFDAICHAMSTTATGGFSTHDASFGYWNSPLIDGIAIVFMLLGGINFGMHWYAWRRATVAHYQADAELFTFLAIAVVATVAVTLNLVINSHFGSVAEAIHHGGFQVVSSLTTTGFITTGYSDWPGMSPLLLLLLGFVGGCAGSTSGGMKVARLQMVVRQGLREIKQLVHPKGQFVVKVGGRRVSESVVISVAGFCTLVPAELPRHDLDADRRRRRHRHRVLGGRRLHQQRRRRPRGRGHALRRPRRFLDLGVQLRDDPRAPRGVHRAGVADPAVLDRIVLSAAYRVRR